MAEEIFTREPKELGESLWTLRNQGEFCDASITVNGQKFLAHAVVLSSNSPFFKDTFKKINTSPKEATFVDVDMNVMQSVIEYCYKGSIKVTEKNATDMYKIANDLKISSLVKICGDFMKKNLNLGNSLSMLEIVKSENDEQLRKHILDFIQKNLNEVFNSEKFVQLEYSDVKELLKTETKPVKDVYDALKKWINHDSSRTNYLNDLLEILKLDCFPKDFLLSEAISTCNENPACLQTFIKAIRIKEACGNQSQCQSSNTLLVVGGNKKEISKILEVYDLNKKEWMEINYNNCNKSYFETVIIDTKLLIIGGYHYDTVNTCEYYDLETGQTESLPPMKDSRYLAATVVFEKSVYVFGGRNYAFLSTAEKWNPSTKTWTDVAKMPTARWKLVAAVLDDEIFVIGGFNGNVLSVTEAYNPKKDTWRTCSNMIESRSDPAIAVVGGFLYVFGGWGRPMSKTGEKYDKTINKWSSIYSLSIPRSASAIGKLDGKIVLVGGFEDGSKVSSLVEVYDDENEKWNPLPPLKHGRYFHQVVEAPWNLAEKMLKRKA